MTQAKPTSKPRKSPKTSGLGRRRRPVHDTPPMPKGSTREGIPQQGPLPHGEELGRPKDSGRHGA